MPPSYFRAILPNADPDDPGRAGAGAILLVFILGVVIRLFACQYTYVINPDGVYYIHQARAIYYGDWHGLTSCHLGFLSSYPFFVAGAYALFHEWIAAAQFVSLFFGSITLIPLYLLCRRFFDRDISISTLLVFALLPLFVAGSSEAVRGPVCWFFLTLGLYFFVGSSERHARAPLLVSCLCLLMASWARIEVFLFILVSIIYLLAVPEKRRIGNLMAFCLPLVGCLLLVFCAVILLDKPLLHTLRLHDIVDKLSAPIIAYEDLRAELSDLMKQPLEGVMPYFLHKSRHLVWLVALGTVLKYMIRAYFYIFFILFVLGLPGVWRGVWEDRRILYLALTALTVFVVFYLHVIQTWMMFDRFWAVFMLPAFMVIGFGLQKGLRIFTTAGHMKTGTALFIVCLLMIACTLPKDLRSKEADKLVYKEIGEMIAHREGNLREIKILKSLRTPDWTAFYANLHYRGAACPRIHFGMEPMPFDQAVFKDYETLIGYLKKNSIPYFLWEEGAWPRNTFDLLDRKRPEDLKEVGTWHHPDVGRVILFRVNP